MLNLQTAAVVTAQNTTNRDIDPDPHPLTAKNIEGTANHKRSIEQMVGELVDNCLDADATTVKIHINETEKGGWVDSVVVADNGKGMDENLLFESYTPGGDRPYRINENGKYGMGGTLSCLAIGNKKSTATKRKKDGVLLGRGYDMAQIKMDKRWISQCLSKGHPLWGESPHEPLWDEYIGDKWSSGTVIKLERLNESIVLIEDPKNLGKYISNEETARPRRNFGTTLANTGKYLRRTFNQDMIMSKLKIYLNDELIKPFCVIGSDLDKADVSEWKDLILNKIVVARYKTCNLVNCDDKEVKDNFAERLDAKCGYYFSRGGRLVTEEPVHKGTTGWNKGPTQHHSVRYGFVSIELDSTRDSLFGVPHTKDSACPGDALQDAIENQLSSFWGQVRKSGEQKDSAKINPTNKKKVFNRAIDKSTRKHVVPRNMKDSSPWIKHIETKAMGISAHPWIYNAMDQKLEINTQHKFVQKCFSGPNSTKHTMNNIVGIAIAFESSLLELHDQLDQEDVNVLIETFFRKMSAISG